MTSTIGQESFTPGPWTYWATRSNRIWVVAQEDSVPLLCEIRTSEADARLIAAAPDLYNALVAISNRVPLKNDVGQDHVCGECRMCFEIADQALRKAEGREP